MDTYNYQAPSEYPTLNHWFFFNLYLSVLVFLSILFISSKHYVEL